MRSKNSEMLLTMREFSSLMRFPFPFGLETRLPEPALIHRAHPSTASRASPPSPEGAYALGDPAGPRVDGAGAGCFDGRMSVNLGPNGSFSLLSAPEALNAPIDTEPGEGEEVIYLAAGCFWGVDKAFWNAPGVVATATGYMGGGVENPSYELVCTNTTGHAETVRVVYSTLKTSAAQLLSRFFEIHDPTQVNRQGNDIGSQYRGAIWTSTPEQLDTAIRARDAYQEELAARGFPAISTQIGSAEEAGPFWYAEEYHQKYLFKNPNGYECHARTGVPCPVV